MGMSAEFVELSDHRADPHFYRKSVKRVVTVSSVSALDYPRDPPYAYTTVS